MNHMSKMNRFRDIKLLPFTLCTGAHLPSEATHALQARPTSLGFARKNKANFKFFKYWENLTLTCSE